MTGLGKLGPIAARKAVEVEALHCAAAGIWTKAETMPPARGLATLRGGKVIAELKRRSPSAGVLRPNLDMAAAARDFEAAGAVALSVLTDGPGFGGSLDDLAAVRSVVQVPLLRKDFIIDPLQVAEARVAGADWVLLIVAMLDDEMLEGCLEAVQRCGARAIVEVHDIQEAERAVAAGAECIGINNRDLRTLRTDLSTFARARQAIPSPVICVAESGVRTSDDVRRLIADGADAVLVGEALMRAASPSAACAQMVAAARAAAST